MVFKKYDKKNEDGSVDVGVSNIFKLKKQAAEEAEQAFKKQMSTINDDIVLMKRYENGLHTTTDKGRLFSATLGKASEAAQKQAEAIQKGTMTTEVWSKKQSDAAKSAKELGKQSQIASLKATALSVAMNVGLSLAITAVFKLIEYATQANVRYVQSQEKIIETANKNISNWDLEKTKIEDLQKSLLDAKGNKEKLWAISGDLNEVIGETPGLTDGAAGAWERANTQLAIQLDLLNRWITRANDQKVEANRNIFEQKTYENEFVAFKDNKGFFSGGLDRSEIIEEAKRIKAEAETMYQLPWDEIIKHEKYGASLYINNAKTRLGELDGYLNEFSSYAKEILVGILDNSDLSATGKQIVNTSIDDMVRNGESIDAINESAKHLIDGYKSISEEQDKLVKASQNGEDTSPFIASIEQQFDELIKKVPAAKTTIEKFYQDLKDSIADNIQTANQTPVSFDLSSEISSLSNLETKYSSLTSAKEELLKNGKISADTGKALVDNDLLQYLEEVDGQLQINTTRFFEDAQAKKKNALLALQDAMYNDILNVALGNTELYSKTAKGALDELSNGISNASSQAGFAIPNVVGFASTVEMAKKAASGQKININTADITARINAVTNAYKPQFTLLENIDTSLEGIGKTAEQAAQDISQAMSKAKSNIESLLSTVISMIKQRYNDQKDGIQKEIDALQERYNLEKDNLDEISEKQKKVFADEKKALEDKKDALKKELDYRLEALKIQQEERSYEKELEEKNKSISDIRTSIAVIKDDNSLEGIAKRKELEEKLAEALSALEDTQFENSIKKQEDALNKEYNDFEEQTETKLDLLDQEEQAYETFHQNRLNESEQRFNDAKSKLEAQIADIDEKTKYEGYIRQEAMRLIDAGGQELYNNLLEYNRKYGDGVDSTITTSWANAYSALKEFDAGQNGVIATLNNLITKMDEYDRSISNAADSAKKLDDIIPGGAGKPPEEDEKEKKENAAKRAKLQSMLKMSINELKTVPPSAKEYKVIRQTIEDLKKQIAELHHTGIDSGTAGGIVKDLQDNEVIAKLTKGEIIITPEQAHTAAKNVENIQSENAQLANIHSLINSIPKDEMQQRIAALLNNNSQEIASIQLNSIRHSIEAMQNKLPSYNTNTQSRQIEVKQGNIVINGGANESIIPIIRKEINRSMDKISNYLYEDMQSVKTEKIQTRG